MWHVYFGWVKPYHTFVTKVSEFSEARFFSYSKLANDSFDFNGLIWDRLHQRAKKQAEAASVIYSFVWAIFLHRVFLVYGLSRKVCQTELHENKKKKIRVGIISYFQDFEVRSDASDSLWIFKNVRLALLLTWEKTHWVFCISLMEKKES